MIRQSALRYALYLVSIELVFIAHSLPAAAVQGVLLALSLLGLAAWRRPAPVHRASALFLVTAGQLSLAFAGFYFSDDALRHIHEGAAIGRGIDVYALTPRSWMPGVPGVAVNWEHSHIGSVYFPFTQLLSVLGFFVSPANGYILLFHLITALLSAYALRGRAAAIVLSPAFVFFSAGRHEDLPGVLAFLCVLLLRKKRPVLAGMLTGTLCFIKPDGILLALFLALYVRRGRFYSGALLAGLGFCGFSAAVLVHGPGTILAFLSNLKMFADLYTGYNPVTVYFPEAWPVVRALLLSGGLLFVILWRKKRTDAFSVLLWLSILSRGVWHPWYFLWPAVFLLFRRRNAAGVLLSLLPLFYIPVADLRQGGGFHFEKFYVACALVLFVSLADKFLTGRPFRRV